MAQQRQREAPSDQQYKAFMDKLGQFRGSLSGDEQQLLDTMVEAALYGKEGDVQAYEWVWVPVPGWHRVWSDTPWGWRWHWVP
jgi:hypothetical protein